LGLPKNIPQGWNRWENDKGNALRVILNLLLNVIRPEYFFRNAMKELSFLFCSAKKETKKAVENQMLRWFSMARAPIALDVGVC